MRCELVVLVASASATAHADEDFRALVAADSYVARSSELDAADVAWSAHLEWRSRERGATLDWVERESLVGGTPRRELHELSYVDRSLVDHVAITAGRFKVPGGFWLIADGAELAAHWGSGELGVFGGSRSFTNGRRETLLTRSPHPLPLAGAALTIRGDLQATIAYTYTSDLVDIYRGDGAVVSVREPEQFVDGELLALIGDRGVITAGATAGTRYLASYPTTPEAIADDPQLQDISFGSQSAYALVDWKLGDWRLAGTAAVLRTKLDQSADPMALAAFAGSFGEASLRIGWRQDQTWRADARYRMRVWADRRYAQRAQLAGEFRRGVLDVQLSGGLDVHRNGDAAAGFPDTTTVLYRASVGYKSSTVELAGGIAATAALGDELMTTPDDPADQRAPYTLEARSYAFVRAFATRGAWFAGFDGELDVHGDGLRALVQIGASR